MNKDQQCTCEHEGRYHFADGNGFVVCRATTECLCTWREAPTSNERVIRKAAADLRRAMTFSWHDYDSLKSALDEASRKVRQVIATLERSAVETQPIPSNLRVIEPFGSKDGVRAEVYISKLGGKPVVVIEADTGSGEDAEVVLNVREAHDLMLWLQCALGQTPRGSVEWIAMAAGRNRRWRSHD